MAEHTSLHMDNCLGLPFLPALLTPSQICTTCVSHNVLQGKYRSVCPPVRGRRAGWRRERWWRGGGAFCYGLDEPCIIDRRIDVDFLGKQRLLEFLSWAP